MVHIAITKGVNLPIAGAPTGGVLPLLGATSSLRQPLPKTVALSYQAFSKLRLKLLAKPGDRVTWGQPLAEDKGTPGRYFVAPGSGLLREEKRGAKRLLLEQLIELEPESEEAPFEASPPSLKSCSREELVEYLLHHGAFAHIRQRPFDTLADPSKRPRAIFVKALESAPFVPAAELQVEGWEEAFQLGLDALTKLTEGPVHLIHRLGTPSSAFLSAKGVERHTAEGAHPIANSSVHIHWIDPIIGVDDVLWTLSALDVVVIGRLLLEGRYHKERVLGLGGPALVEGGAGYYQGRAGMALSQLVADKLEKGPLRLISGDPLMGHAAADGDHLGFYHTCCCAIPIQQEREFLHFFRLGGCKYSFSRAYLSGHLDNSHRSYAMTTNQHGEHRAFIDPTLYDQVMPLPVPTMLLVKALMAEDFDMAGELGLLEVAPEDFALPTFVCPSKMEMVQIVEEGLQSYAHEMLS